MNYLGLLSCTLCFNILDILNSMDELCHNFEKQASGCASVSGPWVDVGDGWC